MENRFWQRKDRNDELGEEIKSHLTLAERDALDSGRSQKDARFAARTEFGSVASAEESTRDSWGRRWLFDLVRDFRYGFRMLRRTPGFSALAVLCLTLGIGANAAVFSWVEGILLRPFPAVPVQDRLVAMASTMRGQSGHDDVSWPDFQDFARNCNLVESFIAEHIIPATLSIGDRAESVLGSVVSANYFDALGVHPFLGRGFTPAEDAGDGGHPVVVISYNLWQQYFHGDPTVVGRIQRLNGLPHTIIGVTPEAFKGTFVGYAIQFWVPSSMEQTFYAGGAMKRDDRGARWIEGFALLKPRVSRSQAQQQISAVAAHLETAYPDTNRGRGVQLYPLWATPFNNAGTLLPTLRIALFVAIFVLVIACANVGSLLLVRAFGRRHEMTVRLSIGAGRQRLVRQLLTEGLILSGFAAVGGIFVAYWCRNMMILFFPSTSRLINLPAQLDWRVLALSACVCIFATLLFALVPAVHASNVDIAGALRAESGGVVGGQGKSRFRSTLVVIQVALSFLLLVASGLVLQSLQRIRNTDPGFSPSVENTIVNLFLSGYDTQRAKNFENELILRVRSLPGVESAAYARSTAFTYRNFSTSPVAVDGYVPPADQQPNVAYNEVGPGFLATMGIPLVSGREFTDADDENSAPVAIVNEVMAAQFWPGRDPVGERVQIKGRWMRIVGVAKVSKYRNMIEQPTAFVYVPLRQNFSALVGLDIRTTLAPAAMTKALSAQIAALDANLPTYEVITMQEQITRMSWQQRASVILLAIFGGLAVLLAGIGLYGVMSYSVSQGTRELGLRLALGAQVSSVLRLVFGRGLAITGAGVVIGAAAALLLTRLMGDMLYKVSPRDPLAFTAAFLVMLAAAGAACFVPAWRASRIDPVRALRD
ncbi:MAG TPA: ABC transporter permease [Candidatus Acidoferrales bacterium]|nr:ABC transporter permease [Candidatus Acidoferrales bacterium]